ncbi:MAG TPA: hypothetical protein VE134_08870 [Methanomicrobiales archaeon]|nr:hypothetical protein [Methanomicrobiales archaeon]
MDIEFCVHYRGDGMPPTSRYCRNCPQAGEACNRLWQRVVDLSRSNGSTGVDLPGTNARIYPNRKNWEIVHLEVNARWGLPKEDFLHFIATGHAGMGRRGMRKNPAASPSSTRQTPYVQAIVHLLGGTEIPEIRAVRRVQRGEPPQCDLQR